ncbi:MAG: hypothetical protein HY066_15375 [Betaproteobacteria bacterium]|nr:hypothetical protein [Betaproteobacteria bacterium]
MGVDTVKHALTVLAVHPKPDADGQSGRDPRRDGKPRQPKPEQKEEPKPFLNALGQPTGKTINTTA